MVFSNLATLNMKKNMTMIYKSLYHDFKIGPIYTSH